MADPNPLVAAKHYAAVDIDNAAGQARLRYITDVPGQQAVYLMKLQQAESYSAAYALDTEASVPPYIDAEATATGQTASQVAAAVLALATTWNDVIGPAIEGARMGGKAAVAAAADLQAVEDARVAAIAALDAI